MALRSPPAHFLGIVSIFYIFQRLLDFNVDTNTIVGSVTAGCLPTNQLAYLDEHTFPFDHGFAARRAKHLIIVAGHSALISHHLTDVGEDENDWYLLDYQIGQGLPQTIKAHIQTALDVAQTDPLSLVIFSGGPTRTLVGPEAEGASYFQAADAMKLWPKHGDVRSRTTTEEFALDSFQNLLFSICRFKEVTGNYPEEISMISFSFKRRRFERVHAPAVQWPPDKFHFFGVDPPASTGFNLAKASEGELQNSLTPFVQDLYGCGELLQTKRRERNPFYRTAPYPLSCPDLQPLLEWCGPAIIPPEMVPWSGKFVQGNETTTVDNETESSDE